MVSHLLPTIIFAVFCYVMFVIAVGSLVTWRERRIIAAARKKLMWDALKQ